MQRFWLPIHRLCTDPPHLIHQPSINHTCLLGWYHWINNGCFVHSCCCCFFASCLVDGILGGWRCFNSFIIGDYCWCCVGDCFNGPSTLLFLANNCGRLRLIIKQNSKRHHCHNLKQSWPATNPPPPPHPHTPPSDALLRRTCQIIHPRNSNLPNKPFTRWSSIPTSSRCAWWYCIQIEQPTQSNK